MQQSRLRWLVVFSVVSVVAGLRAAAAEDLQLQLRYRQETSAGRPRSTVTRPASAPIPRPVPTAAHRPLPFATAPPRRGSTLPRNASARHPRHGRRALSRDRGPSYDFPATLPSMRMP